MKRIISITVAMVVIMMLSTVMVSGAQVTYTTMPGTPTINGMMGSGEWESAAPLLIDASYAGKDADDLKLEFRMMYDSEYLYILEIREDSKLVYPFDNNLAGLQSLWWGDSTLFFVYPGEGTAYGSNSSDIWYAAQSKNQGSSILGIRKNDDFSGLAPYTEGQIAASVEGDKAITEIAFKWADIPGAASGVSAGDTFKFAIVIPQIKDDASAQNYQINWEYSPAESSSNPFPIMTLGSAPTTAPSETDESDDGPATGDNSIIILVVFASVSLLVITINKKKILA